MARSPSSPDWTGLGVKQRRTLRDLLPLRADVDSEAVLARVEREVHLHALTHDTATTIPAAQKAVKALAMKAERAERLLREIADAFEALPMGLLGPASDQDEADFLATTPAIPRPSLRACFSDLARRAESPVRDLRTLSDSVHRPRRGPAIRLAETSLAIEMGRLWEETTGNRAALQNRNSRGDNIDGGPFLDFLREVLRIAWGPRGASAARRLARVVAERLRPV